MYSYTREAVRVKVKKCEENCPPEWRKFSVDPQITSVEILHSILAKAFDIKSDFSIYYKALDPLGNEKFLAVLSDWDLHAAFRRTHNYSVQTGSEPCLNLRVNVLKIMDKNDSGIEMNYSSSETNKLDSFYFQQSLEVGQKYVQNMQIKLPSLFMNHMEKTFSMVQRALNFAEEQIPVYPPRPPLSDSEFRSFLNSVGQIIRPQELRKAIFLGGVDPSLRRVVWKHILNVYPKGMTGRERMDYMKTKAAEYQKLRDVWKTAIKSGSTNTELAYVTSMVRKDVLRTDRLHPFYAGSDDNQNVESLFNILTTYALNHPKVSYCQGMSDLASPLLVTMNDESHAYICFCAIMERLQSNFMIDGVAMTQKFQHLTLALQYYDSEFYEYLRLQQADDLLFCYRWLLLELKREFPFEDSLRMLEVQWSSLRTDPPEKEIKLFDEEFVPENPPHEMNICDDKTKMEIDNCTRKPNNLHSLRQRISSLSLYSNFSPTHLNHINMLDDDEDDNERKQDKEINDLSCNRLKRLTHSLDENNSRISLQRINFIKSYQSLDETKLNFLNEPPKQNSISENQELPNDKINENKYTVNKKIVFHSTNPFIEDAQGGSTEILILDDKIDRKATVSRLSYVSIENLPNENIPFGFTKDLTVSTVENVKTSPPNGKHKGHFQDLKDKIAASKQGSSSSIESIYTQSTTIKKNEQNIKQEYSTHLKLIPAQESQNKPFSITESDCQSKTTDETFIKPKKSKNTEAKEENETTQNILNSNRSLHERFFSPHAKNISPTKTILDNNDHNNSKLYGHNSLSLNNTNSSRKSDEVIQNIHVCDINMPLKISNNPNEAIAKDNPIEHDNDREFIKYKRLYKNSDTYEDSITEDKTPDIISYNEQETSPCSSRNIQPDVFIWENPLHLQEKIKDRIDNQEISKCNISFVHKASGFNPFLNDFIDNEISNVCRQAKNEYVNQKIVENQKKLIINNEVNDLEEPNLIEIAQKPETATELTVSTSAKIMDYNQSSGEQLNSEQLPPMVSEVKKFLPVPKEFGGGNPFLIFLCLTLLLQHRTGVMRNNLDYNEMAMHFDKMVRKHDVNRVLNQARRMYFEYLKVHDALANAAKNTGNKATENYINKSNDNQRKS